MRAGATTRRAIARSRSERFLRHLPPHAKVQLGCGTHALEGWVNVDINRSVHPDLRVDLRGGFPAPAGSATFIFSEHLFEHLSLEDGQRLIADCYAALEPNGVMRIAMPDLRYIVERYLGLRDETMVTAEANSDHDYGAIDSPALLLNHALRSWGHLYLYDLDELSLRLRQAGFGAVSPQPLGKSSHPELSDLEQRPESRLIVEATR